MDLEISRREFIAGSVTLALSFSGCLGSGNQGGGGDNGDQGSIGNHASADGLDSQPYLGPSPFDAGATVIAFEDPSCPTCARFERESFPRMMSPINSGKLSFVYRVYPVIYEWGKPAVQALEATYARDESAFWDLKDHYYAEQSQFNTENVLDRTRDFLESNTGVDASGVVEDARNKKYNDAVQLDLNTGKKAGAGSVTPTFFLFREREYVTKLRGYQDYSVFKTTLGL
ncbi:MAG: thioredoxin domain-containing protein [Halobacteria archaeon]|nr:thioredoxin domain-containing protein [Halobacteria archaeon]